MAGSRFRFRNLALGALVLLAVAGAVLLLSGDARRAVNLRAAEMAGDAAAAYIADNATGGHAANFIKIPVEVRKLHEIVYQARGVANTQVVATKAGHVVFDTGLATQAAKQRRLLDEALPPGPITHVILSHSHQDHAGGTQFWQQDGTEVVAHREYPEEQRYLKALEGYFWQRNRTLFPFMPESPPQRGPFAYGNVRPTRLVDTATPYEFEQGGVQFVVLGTPGAEGADNVCLWLPQHKILLTGDFFGPNFPQFPNVFTMRGEKIRKPMEYIASLERIIALEPEMIVPSHQDPILGHAEIRADLVKMRDAVRYVHDATIAGMNAGKTVHELMEEIRLPPELALTQIHGRVSWAVKSIWEYYATWFHFDSTTELYSVPASAMHAEIAELAGVEPLIERAGRHVAADAPERALHLLEVALAREPNHRAGLETRRTALEQLLARAESTFQNSYEMDWLRYRIRATEAALDAVSDGPRRVAP